MKNLAIALAVVAGGAVLAYFLYARSPEYYPVARVDAPGGITYTALHDATEAQRDCSAANDRFLEPIKAQCEDCKIVFARCELDKAEALDLVLNARHWVVSPGLRIAVAGPEESAKLSCDLIAADLQKRGIRSSGCLHPAASGSGS